MIHHSYEWGKGRFCSWEDVSIIYHLSTVCLVAVQMIFQFLTAKHSIYKTQTGTRMNSQLYVIQSLTFSVKQKSRLSDFCWIFRKLWALRREKPSCTDTEESNKTLTIRPSVPSWPEKSAWKPENLLILKSQKCLGENFQFMSAKAKPELPISVFQPGKPCEDSLTKLKFP